MGLKDFLMKPTELPYDFEEWTKLPFHERLMIIKGVPLNGVTVLVKEKESVPSFGSWRTIEFWG